MQHLRRAPSLRGNLPFATVGRKRTMFRSVEGLSMASWTALWLVGLAAVLGGSAVTQRVVAQTPAPTSAATLTGAAALGDWTTDKPGLRRLITVADLPPPSPLSQVASNAPGERSRPSNVKPTVPPGFSVDLFAEGLDTPRVIRVAPNGDVFVAETGANRIVVFHPPSPPVIKPTMSVFASGFDYPYGIAFYPAENPQWVYVAQTNRVVRFAYQAGDTKAHGMPEQVVGGIPGDGHITRDIAFSPDGKRLYVAIGSASNDAERLFGLGPPDGTSIAAWEAANGLGAAWSYERNRAGVAVFDPDGKNGKMFATGIRNCAGITVQPGTGDVWCATNERDDRGDNLPPDYATRVTEGAFYGWPWFYIGNHQDPRHPNERADLAGKVTVPDVLFQAHSAPLGITFYDGTMFPAEYRGDAFVTLHGSWNRSKRTGYKVVRVPMKDGKPTGESEDFMVGMVLSNTQVWGRPVGIAVAKDGSLLVSEDGTGTIWRVSATK
jgi:glucose/arabinose dehydrogenase